MNVLYNTIQIHKVLRKKIGDKQFLKRGCVLLKTKKTKKISGFLSLSFCLYIYFFPSRNFEGV